MARPGFLSDYKKRETFVNRAVIVVSFVGAVVVTDSSVVVVHFQIWDFGEFVAVGAGGVFKSMMSSDTDNIYIPKSGPLIDLLWGLGKQFPSFYGGEKGSDS
jgi:hypothetical protein